MLRPGTADLGLANLGKSDLSLKKRPIGSKNLLNHVKLVSSGALPPVVKHRHGLSLSKATLQRTDHLIKVHWVTPYFAHSMIAFMVR